MSAAIQKSLGKLNSAVAKLETAIEAKKAVPAPVKKASGPQNDLFSALGAVPAQAAQMNAANVKMLATRLDHAINQVEEILKEGRG